MTFNSRYDWAPKNEGEEDEPMVEWKAPDEQLRIVYMDMLKRLLRAGVPREMTWRLYSLVRRETTRISSTETETLTQDMGSETNGTESQEMPPPPRKTARKGPGTLRLQLPRPEDELDETIDPEVLHLLSEAMSSWWPGCFVFNGGGSGEIGGLELRDMGRTWPKADRGINFTVSLLGSESLGVHAEVIVLDIHQQAQSVSHSPILLSIRL